MNWVLFQINFIPHNFKYDFQAAIQQPTNKTTNKINKTELNYLHSEQCNKPKPNPNSKHYYYLFCIFLFEIHKSSAIDYLSEALWIVINFYYFFFRIELHIILSNIHIVQITLWNRRKTRELKKKINVSIFLYKCLLFYSGYIALYEIW